MMSNVNSPLSWRKCISHPCKLFKTRLTMPFLFGKRVTIIEALSSTSNDARDALKATLKERLTHILSLPCRVGS